MNGNINYEAALKKRRAAAPVAAAPVAAAAAPEAELPAVLAAFERDICLGKCALDIWRAKCVEVGNSAAFLPDAKHLTVAKCTTSGSYHHAASGVTAYILRAADERDT